MSERFWREETGVTLFNSVFPKCIWPENVKHDLEEHLTEALTHLNSKPSRELQTHHTPGCRLINLNTSKTEHLPPPQAFSPLPVTVGNWHHLYPHQQSKSWPQLLTSFYKLCHRSHFQSSPCLFMPPCLSLSKSWQQWPPHWFLWPQSCSFELLPEQSFLNA